MLKARFIPVILGLVLFGGAALAQTEVDTTAASVDHQIKVHLPTVVALSITKDGSTSDLSFTVTASQYYSNIGAPIAPDATGFNHLTAFTNDASGAELSVGVVDSAGTAASAAVLDAVTLDGGNISAYTDSVAAGPPQTILSRNDYALTLTGSETPGDWTYTVTYTLTAN